MRLCQITHNLLTNFRVVAATDWTIAANSFYRLSATSNPEILTDTSQQEIGPDVPNDRTRTRVFCPVLLSSMIHSVHTLRRIAEQITPNGNLSILQSTLQRPPLWLASADANRKRLNIASKSDAHAMPSSLKRHTTAAKQNCRA